MKGRLLIAALLAIVLMTPFVLNTLGKNYFLYLNVGPRVYMIGASSGLAHLATSDPIGSFSDFTALGADTLEAPILVERGPFSLVIEKRYDSLRPFNFGASIAARYAYVEFPLPLLLIIPLAILLIPAKTKEETTDSPSD